MKYIGQFRNIDEKLYEIDITTSGETPSTKEIVLGDTPIITSYVNDDNLFKPVKYSSGTVKIVTTDYHFDIYSNKAQDSKIELFSVGTGGSKFLQWVGYATPNLYNQPWESEVDELEIECIDALSTLQYYKYSSIDNAPKVHSFKDILLNLIKKCNAYTSLVISQNYQNNTYQQDYDYWSQVYLSEKNFFDEDGVPMQCDEVLEELCKYMGVTAIAFQNTVYLLDYTDNNLYWRYNFVENYDRKTTLTKDVILDGKAFAENGQELSLGETYNKITVKDSLYSYDKFLPSIYDKKDIKNRNGENNIQQENLYFSAHGSGVVNQKFKGYFKYYDNSNYKFYYYNKKDMSSITPVFYEWKYQNTLDWVGATLTKHYCFRTMDYNEEPESLNFKDYVLIHNHNTQDGVMRPMFSYQPPTTDQQFFLGGKGAYVIIKGSIRIMDRPDVMFIMDDYHNKDDNFHRENLFIWCSFNCGNYWWNGSSWVTDPTTKFKLFFDAELDNSHLINKDFPVKSNVKWTMGLGDVKGYAIPMPESGANTSFSMSPQFTMYQPQQVDGHYRMDAIWLSDFDVVSKLSNNKTDEEFDSDTEYSNTINDEFVNDFDEISFKICTWDNKECNYSSPCYKKHGNSIYQYIDKIYNVATGNKLRSEEHYIFKLMKEYSTPPIVLEINMNQLYEPWSWISNKFFTNKFLIDTQAFDWRMNNNAIKLVEKK